MIKLQQNTKALIKTLVPLNPSSSADNPFVIEDQPFQN